MGTNYKGLINSNKALTSCIYESIYYIVGTSHVQRTTHDFMRTCLVYQSRSKLQVLVLASKLIHEPFQWA